MSGLLSHPNRASSGQQGTSMSSTNRRLANVVQQIQEGADALNKGKNEKEESKFAPYAPFTNYAETFSCTPEKHYRPSSTQEVATIVKQLYQQGAKIKAVGTGASPNGVIAFTDHHMIHIAERLNKVVSIDNKKMQITCEGGVTLKHLHSMLDEAEMMLPCIPSWVNSTVAGCIATGTHSTGSSGKCFGDYATRFTAVTGTGEVITVDRKQNPEEWSYWACSLGVLGIVTEVTLQAERKCTFHKYSAPIHINTLKNALAERVAQNDEYYRFHWIPHTDMCYETSIRRVSNPDDDGAELRSTTGSVSAFSTTSGKKQVGVLSRLGGQDIHVAAGDVNLNLNRDNMNAVNRALRDPHAMKKLWERQEKEKVARTKAASRFLPDTSNLLHTLNPLELVQSSVLERSLHMATFTPSLQPVINQAYQKAYLNEPSEMYGNALEVMEMDCLFKQYTSEWAIPADRAVEALEAIRTFIQQNKLKVHFPVEFRFTDADTITMSPAQSRKTCWIGIVMFRPFGRDAPDTKRYMELFSNKMFEMEGRPHWCKHYDLDYRTVGKMYGMDKWNAFNAYRKKVCDPKGLLVNDWFAKLLA